MTSNTFSKHDQDFADAMATKLRLNREQLNNESSENSIQANDPSETVEENFRESMILEGLEEFPGLTREEVLKVLEEMGF